MNSILDYLGNIASRSCHVRCQRDSIRETEHCHTEWGLHRDITLSILHRAAAELA